MALQNRFELKERDDLPPEPVKKEPDGKAGEDYCQLCGHDKMNFIGGMDYDTEDFECKQCGAIHTMRITYRRGKRESSCLESII